MRKLVQILAATVASFAMMGAVAGAQANACSIVNTGQGSNNSCTVNATNDLVVTCTNTANVVYVNGQSSNSGSVTLNNNTNGGYAYSGNAVNQNSSNTALDVGCAAKPAAATTTTPATGGMGGGSTTTPAANTPASLPNTGTSSVAKVVTAATAVLASLALATSFAFGGLRRHFEK